MAQSMRLTMVAGETSGDLLGGLLLSGLRGHWPELSAHGIGGSRMQAEGFRSDWPMERLSVFGYVDAIKRLPELLRIRRELGDAILRERPAAFIGIDAPDFNFGLEQRLRQNGIKTVHFVCPSIWAWRSERVHKIAAATDHVLCLFPFEPALLAQHGIAATYVGHPLASVIPEVPDTEAARHALGLSSGDQVVAVLPGSRRSEIDHVAPRFIDAVKHLARMRPNLRFILPAVPQHRERIRQLIHAAGAGHLIQILEGQSHTALAACDVTLIASGTATLEAALYKRPMVIAYNMGWLSWQTLKRKKLQPWVGLPNILSQSFVVPELLQDAATPQALAAGVADWLDSPGKVELLKARFNDLHQQLKRDTASLASHAIQKVLEG